MVSFTYDADGLRLTKVVDGVTHYYVWQGDRLVSESYGTSTLEFFYDESGMPYAFYFYDTASTTNNGYYYYVTNLQGDVVGIRDNSGVSKAVYQYNAWGEDIDTTAAVSNIETINPLRYRGYYYDSETKLYYLQSRYYDPVVCRFINADEFAATGQGFLGYNMFAYCNNNPATNIDSSGNSAIGIALAISAIAGGIVGGIVGGFSAVAKGESAIAGVVSGIVSGSISGVVATGTVIVATAAAAFGGLAVVGTVLVGAMTSGAVSAGGEYLNQIGNNLAKGDKRTEWYKASDTEEIIEAGVVGAATSPLSFAGGALTNTAFKGVVDKFANGIAETLISGINAVIGGIARAIA